MLHATQPDKKMRSVNSNNIKYPLHSFGQKAAMVIYHVEEVLHKSSLPDILPA